ncbi:uncharacterized protein LOC117645487 [Thrips palmi]|uniref:Uncharacterized protein LOC117645487 n=1 Tax=Thrips palmi TaxID=161013 RepID=A0A6P8YNU2_THRPL|nr:uncharacterized protein LOC117645487 [Thrips palmi]
MAASLLTLTSWMELSRLRSTAEAHDNLLVSVNAMDRTHKDPSPSDWSPVPSLLARLGLTFLLGSTLCMCSAWVVMGFGASHWSHLPAYVYQSTVAHLVTVSQVCDFLRLRDVARRLLNLLQQEVCPAAARVRAFRHAWLLVYRNACQHSVLPVTATVHMTVLLLLFTINGYTAALACLAVNSGQRSDSVWPQVFISSFGAMINALSILAINDAAHRLAEEIETPFLEMLQRDNFASRLHTDIRCEVRSRDALGLQQRENGRREGLPV